MSVTYYEWGQVPWTSTGGGGGGGGGGTASSGPPEVFTGTCAAATIITYTKATISVMIENTHDSYSLDISVDGGLHYIVLEPHKIFKEAIKVTTTHIKPTVLGNSPTYVIVAAITP